jgi:hypothetical protein
MKSLKNPRRSTQKGHRASTPVFDVSAPKSAEKKCSACGDLFLVDLTSSGKRPKTCSVECRVVAMDKLIDSLIDQRFALIEMLGGVR